MNSCLNPRVVIPDSKISSSLGGPISVEQIEINKISIPKLSMKDFEAEFEYQECIAKDVHISITLDVDFHFDGTIIMPSCIPDQDVSGDVHFNTFEQGADLGDITFISVNNQKIKMSSDEMTMGPLSMTPEPIGDGNTDITKIENMEVRNVKMKCSEIPLPNPLGVYLDSYFPIPNPMESNDVLIEETNMESLNSTKISSPKITMKDIQSLDVKINSVKTKPFTIFSDTDLPAVSMTKKTNENSVRSGDATRTDDNFKGTITLNVKKVTLDVKGGLEFKELKGIVKSASATSDPFNMDLNIQQMKIKGLNICGMNIPELMVEF